MRADTAHRHQEHYSLSQPGHKAESQVCHSPVALVEACRTPAGTSWQVRKEWLLSESDSQPLQRKNTFTIHLENSHGLHSYGELTLVADASAIR